jgi:DNA-binding NtrC family response regulator
MRKKEGSILMVDDNEELLIAYEIFLSPHFQSIQTLANPNSIPSVLQDRKFDVILLDMNFSTGIHTGNEGFFWMKKILELDRDVSIVFITAYGDVEQAIRAIREGATDFILKAWDKEKILSTILSAYQLRKSRQEITQLKSKQNHLMAREQRDFDFCQGSSAKMKEVLFTVKKVAPTEANLLILGENGTGKEVLARYIHQQSLRSGEIFVAIDVGSIAEHLFESELFGHTKGAFTDASEDKAGRMELASGGTLFLDEIGNLPLSLQAKLLSVIEKKELTRLGSTQVLPVDVRLICATNANLYQLSEEGKFREDLLYRINNIQIDLPPLRERQEDIPHLLAFFLEKFAEKYNKPGLSISKLAVHQLSKFPWKGNIRELRNVLEKAVLLSESQVLKPADFVIHPPSRNTAEENQVFNLEANEKKIIRKALENFGYNKKLTARELGINRTTLYNKMRKHGME